MGIPVLKGTPAHGLAGFVKGVAVLRGSGDREVDGTIGNAVVILGDCAATSPSSLPRVNPRQIPPSFWYGRLGPPWR